MHIINTYTIIITYRDEIANFHIVEGMSSIPFLESVNLIDNFYKSNDINLDVNDLVNKGIIYSVGNQYENGEHYSQIEKYGVNICYRSTGIKEIQIQISGTLRDTFILVHELSHYREIPFNINGKYIYSYSNNLFNEAMADADAFMFLNNQESNFETDKLNIAKDRIVDYIKQSIHSSNFIKLCMMYRNNFDISEKNYIEIFKKSNYEIFIRYFSDKRLKLDKLRSSISYMLCALVVPQVLKKQKENPDYFKKIGNLRDKLANDMTFNEILNFLELPTDEEELLQVLENNLTEMCENVFNDERRKDL